MTCQGAIFMACYEKPSPTCHAERQRSICGDGWLGGCQGAGQLRPSQPRTSGAPASLGGAQLACALALQRTAERVCHGMPWGETCCKQNSRFCLFNFSIINTVRLMLPGFSITMLAGDYTPQ